MATNTATADFSSQVSLLRHSLSAAGKSAMTAAADMQMNQESRIVRNEITLATTSSTSWNGSIFFRQPSAKNPAPVSSSCT